MGGSNVNREPWMMAVFVWAMVVVVFVLGIYSTFQCFSCSSESVANQSTNNEELTQSLPTIYHLGSSVFFFVKRNVYPDGYYYTTLFIGNPPKPYLFGIDTASDLTWVQCVPSPKIPHQPYKPHNNFLSCKDPLCKLVPHPSDYPCKNLNDQCYYIIDYNDGLSTGLLARDSFTLSLTNGSFVKPTLTFGCGNNQRFGGDTPSSDGLLGLANTKLSIVSQLSDQGLIRNVIGHCLGRRGTGFFFLGDDLVSHFEIVWMPMLPNSIAYYSPGWAQLLLNGKTTGHKDIYTFDSGSTYSYFNSKTYQATLSWLKKNLIGKPLKAVADVPHLPVCWKGPKPFNSTEEVKNYFKPLGLSFSSRNVQLQLPPEAYLIISNHGNVCLGILDGGSQTLMRPFNVIGEISLQDKLVVYDNEKKRIGWAPSSCNRPF